MITQKQIQAYIHHRNLLNKGKGELEWAKNIIQIAALGAVGFKVFGFSNTVSLMLSLISGFLYLVVSYFLGWWWEKRKAFDVEARWSMQRNPDIQEIKRARK